MASDAVLDIPAIEAKVRQAAEAAGGEVWKVGASNLSDAIYINIRKPKTTTLLSLDPGLAGMPGRAGSRHAETLTLARQRASDRLRLQPAPHVPRGQRVRQGAMCSTAPLMPGGVGGSLQPMKPVLASAGHPVATP